MSRYNYSTKLLISDADISWLNEHSTKPHYKRLMSGEYSLSYGYDHALYYFIQLWTLDSGGEEVISLEKDGLFDDFSGFDLSVFLDRFHVSQEHAHLAAMDLPL